MLRGEKEEIKFLHIYKRQQQQRRLCKEIFFSFLLRKGDHQMKCSCDVIRVLARDTHIGLGLKRRELLLHYEGKKKKRATVTCIVTIDSTRKPRVLVKYLNIFYREENFIMHFKYIVIFYILIFNVNGQRCRNTCFSNAIFIANLLIIR